MKIFTMTLAISLKSSVDLYSIANYLKIEDQILGLKYKIGDLLITKGICKGSGSFENQVTLIVDCGESKKLNVKIFSNGKLQITGCTSKNDAIKVKKILEEKFDGVHVEKVGCDILDENGIPIKRYQDHDTIIIFGRDLGTCIGIKKGNLYLINFSDKCYFDKTRSIFVSQKNLGKYTYSIYDLNGNKIGIKKLNLFNSKKIFYKNGGTVFEIYESGLLVSGEHIIGKYEYDYNEGHDERPTEQTIWKDDNDSSSEPEIYSLMFTFNINSTIDRQHLFKQFIENGYIVKYNPNNYSGVILTVKIKNGKIIPLCDCSKKICGCNKITAIFFESGNVICSGIKNENDTYLIQEYLTHKLDFLLNLKFNLLNC